MTCKRCKAPMRPDGPDAVCPTCGARAWGALPAHPFRQFGLYRRLMRLRPGEALP